MPIEAQTKALTDVTEHKTSQELLRNIQLAAASSTRSIVLLLMLVVGLAYQSALRARAGQNENTVKIMTQNLDAGKRFQRRRGRTQSHGRNYFKGRIYRRLAQTPSAGSWIHHPSVYRRSFFAASVYCYLYALLIESILCLRGISA
jgi:hypothetical protein